MAQPAKFKSLCPICKKAIFEGDMIERHVELTVFTHSQCAQFGHLGPTPAIDKLHLDVVRVCELAR
jgi:hypothetical protein